MDIARPVAGSPGDARIRIGVEVFGTQTPSRLRGIGRYSRNLLEAMLARDPLNKYFLYGQAGLPTDQIPITPNAVLRLVGPDPARGETLMAQAMERVVATNPDGIDVLLLLNPLELGYRYDPPARPFRGPKMVSVVYDLIPALFQEQYLHPDFVRRYFQALARLRNYDALLAISEATRRDCLSLLSLPADRVVAIGTASDGRFFTPDRSEPMPPASRSIIEGLGISRPFVFSVGSLEYRKNVWGLIDAFSMLSDGIRQTHDLVLTYNLSGPDRDRVVQYARDRGVDGRLVVTDRLDDESLRVLYQRCAAFVFPSAYEGFGLPVLEAMHCGAAVIAGNNSSQVEVVGNDAGLLFNVADAVELATHLSRLLGDPDRARRMGERAEAYARRFQWDDVAARALDVVTRPVAPEATAPSRPARRRAPKRRIAFFSPLPPLRSGISDYSARLLAELKHRYTIDVYHHQDYVPHLGLGSSDFACHDHRLFRRNAGVLGYHALVYQMGNSHYHGYIYEAMLRHPGVVTLHDLGLVGFHTGHSMRPDVDGPAHLRREFEAYFGPSMDGAPPLPDGSPGSLERMRAACIERALHLNGRVFEQATAVVVHSPWCVEQARMRFPRQVEKISVIGFGATALEPTVDERRATRARLELPTDALIVASLGILHETKMNVETIAAFAPIARERPEALLLLVGVELDGGEARREAARLGIADRVRFLGHYPGDLADVAAIADIGVCLRQPPTNGETSASLMDLLRLGVPTIVSDVGTFSGFPDSVVRKHRMEVDGIPGLTRALRDLADDRLVREALGRSALNHVHRHHSWSGAADAYEEVIERAAASAGPLRAAS